MILPLGLATEAGLGAALADVKLAEWDIDRDDSGDLFALRPLSRTPADVDRACYGLSTVRPCATAQSRKSIERVYSLGEPFGQQIATCAERQMRTFGEYSKGKDPSALQRADFLAHFESKEPDCHFRLLKSAPVLRFKFVNQEPSPVILRSVDVEVAFFDEYKGGGGGTRRSAFDIELPTERGSYSFPIREGNGYDVPVIEKVGEVKLRVFSGNYRKYAGQGWISPLGSFLLKIRFQIRMQEREPLPGRNPIFLHRCLMRLSAGQMARE